MDKRRRILSFDIIRVVAMCFVIAVHALGALDGNWSGSWLVIAWCQALFFTANAMFFMLSGRFNLKEREHADDLRSYFLRKVRGIIIPVLLLFFCARYGICANRQQALCR